MDKNKIDMYFLSNHLSINAKYFPTEKIEAIKESMSKLDDSYYCELASLDIRDPDSMLLISIIGGQLGLDRFLLRDIKGGILKVISMCCCIGVIWWIYDIIFVKKNVKNSNFKLITEFLIHRAYNSNDIKNYNSLNNKNNESNNAASAVNVSVSPSAEKAEKIEPASQISQTANIQSTPVTDEKAMSSEPIAGLAIDVLVKRAFLFLEDGNFSEADRYLEQALNQDPENSRAYLGKLMAEKQIRTEDDFAKLNQPLDDEKFFKRALRFANDDEKARLQGYAQAVRAN